MPLNHYCQAVFCSYRVPPGKLFCDRHRALLPDHLATAVRGIDADGLLYRRVTPEVLDQLEAVATAIEAVAAAEKNPAFNYFRKRATTWRKLQAREAAREAAQGAAGGIVAALPEKTAVPVAEASPEPTGPSPGPGANGGAP